MSAKSVSAHDDKQLATPHALTPMEIAAALGSDCVTGLSNEVAAERLQMDGFNQLPSKKIEPVWVRFFKQFKNLLIIILLIAAALALALHEWLEAGVIMAVVMVNAVIGFYQEGKAEQALRSIQSMLAEHTRVIRSGQLSELESKHVVRGDLVSLQAGDLVPADIRLIKVSNFAVQEAALTGESIAVDKTASASATNAPLAERKGMAFAGTLVTQGQAQGIVVATASQTELGRVNSLLTNVAQLTTPLLRQMAQFAKALTVAILIVAALVFIVGLSRGHSIAYMLMAVVSLVVAAIPEGLPTILTVALAIGVTRMASRHAIIRRLPAVETIGAVSVICSDKTGTLTRNEMTVTSLATAGQVFSVSGDGYAPQGHINSFNELGFEQLRTDIARVACLCNESRLVNDNGEYRVEGDPMEGALLTLAHKTGIDLDTLAQDWPRVSEIPFDSRYKYMATMHACTEPESPEHLILLKGAPEAILARCGSAANCQVWNPSFWLQQITDFAQGGHRVLALAHKKVVVSQVERQPLTHDDLYDFELVALLAIMDPPRDEAIEAIDACHRAGITVKMITGDHVQTAQAIGKLLHLPQTEQALTGQDVDTLSDTELTHALETTHIFARTTPEHKLRLVSLLQAQGKIVAMTGDGVNDAPALKRADIGIAMGKGGTAAAREASDMVLTDDNFASIVDAVGEGRTVYDNLKKAITFLLPVNGGESLAIMLALLIGLALPIMPLQILWVNMVSSIALALALAFEPSESDTMQRPPRRANEPWITRFVLWRIIFVSILFTVGIFTAFEWALAQGYSEEYARTLAVNVLVAMEVFYLFSVRYLRRSSLFFNGLKGTRHVLLAVGLVFGLQLLFTYQGWLQALFNTTPLSLTHGLLCVVAGCILFTILELEKWAQRRWHRQAH